ncbi:MAG: MATE family efflux transporter, partial [Alphaproteobacteria bacterium]
APESSVATRPASSRTPGGIAEVAALAFPAVLHTLSDTLMQVVDSAIVGRLGVVELGAIGFAGVWLWTLTSGFVGAATGVQTFVAQDVGAGRARSSARWAVQGLWAIVPVAAIFFLLVRASIGSFFALLGPSPELRDAGTAYARARLLGAPAIPIAIVFNSWFRGLGDTRTPLAVAVAANVVNALLSWGLVFGVGGLPRLGVAGAGYGASAAMVTAASLLSWLFLRRRAAIAREAGTDGARGPSAAPGPRAIARLLRTSAPIGGAFVLDMITFALFTTVLARMGDRAMAASQAMIQLLSLSFMQAVGIGIAAAALVGRYVGARDLDTARRSHRSAIALGIALTTLVGALFLAVPDLLLRIFTEDPEVIAIGRPLLRLGAFFQVADAAGIVAAGSLRGAGDTTWPFAVQAALAWLYRVPAVWLAAVWLGGGVEGAWWAELGYVVLLGATLLARFERGAWREARI